MKYVVLFVTVIIFVSGCSGRTTDASTVTATGNVGFNVGDTAPDFTIADVDGNSYSLSELKGKPVLFAYFATWCVPCRIEAKNVKQVDDESGGNAFEVFQIGIDGRETVNDLKVFKEQLGNNDWIVGFGFDVSKLYNVRFMDTTLIVDKEGVIVYRDNGVPANAATLRRWLT